MTIKFQAQEFTTPGAFTFNVPSGVSMVFVSMIGGGASGAASDSGATSGGGGGSGEYCLRLQYAVTAGGTVSGSVGAGGAGVTPPTLDVALGNDGGTTSFGQLRALGGRAQATSTAGGGGGGLGGGAAPLAENAANMGAFEGCGFSGGGSGGGGASLAASPNMTPGADSINGKVGGATGTPNCAGAGGAASPWGDGGGGGTRAVNDGSAIPIAGDAYGAGGGGTARSSTPTVGFSGDGGDGYVLVEWFA